MATITFKWQTGYDIDQLIEEVKSDIRDGFSLLTLEDTDDIRKEALERAAQWAEEELGAGGWSEVVIEE